MPFQNPPPETIAALLKSARTIAVLGLSDNPARPSCGVALSMQRYGYRIIPVNPALKTWQGIPAIPDLSLLGTVLRPGDKVDIVNVFRQPRHVAAIVDECLELKLPALWLQLGVVDETAAERARAGGMTVVMDRCIYIDRAELG
ncbi:MAG: CoA-binding protein [Steroidobacteraceae bacterium]